MTVPPWSLDDLDLHRLGVVDEGLGDVFDEIGCCHRGPYFFSAGQDAGGA